MKKFLVALAIAGWLGLTVYAWSTPVKHWRLNSGDDAPMIDIIDTSGVCLYVARSYGNTISITAVSKTVIPAGAGCQ